MSNKSLAVLDNALKSKKYKNKPYIIIPRKEANVISITLEQYKTLLQEYEAHVEHLEYKLRQNNIDI